MKVRSSIRGGVSKKSWWCGVGERARGAGKRRERGREAGIERGRGGGRERAAE